MSSQNVCYNKENEHVCCRIQGQCTIKTYEYVPTTYLPTLRKTKEKIEVPVLKRLLLQHNAYQIFVIILWIFSKEI